MSSSLTDVSSKLAALKERKETLAVTDKEVDRVLRAVAPDEASSSGGCLSSFRICPTWFSRGSRVSTIEPTCVGKTTELRQSGENNRLIDRLVGVRKGGSETNKIQLAMQTVQLRVESLSDRVKIGRERALMARKAGKQEEAVRELRKSKAVEKQLGAARLALDTLERQEDLIAQTTLQRELATALKSTTADVKSKSKGLLSLAESAIDESVEVRDDADDVAAVFEGIAPAYETGMDDGELLAELDELVGTTVALPTAVPEPTSATSGSGVELFPAAPQRVPAKSPPERTALLSDDSARASRGV